MAGLTPLHRERLLVALWNWKNNATLMEQNQLSGLMSQSGAVNRPGRTLDRSYRRASILLRCAVTDPFPGNWQGHKDFVNRNYRVDFAGGYAMEVENAIDAYHSRPVVGANLIMALKTDPARFLTTYKLSVNGAGASGNVPYGLQMNNRTLRFECEPPPPGRATTPAIKVGVTAWASVAAPGYRAGLQRIQGVDTSAYPGVDLLFTTQFTGCTYCFMKNPAGTEVVAAHIDPGANPVGGRLPRPPEPRRGHVGPPLPPTPGVLYATSGELISERIRANGGFQNANGGVFKAYGRNPGVYGYGTVATAVIIMGIKRGGVWEIWRQLQTLAGFDAARIDQ